ncbi:DUF6385 domain-containing protein [Desulfovirgula thermocuniculi]|uniref:DUF6385 domain-containing protein n=1 Tax=Desulfovirgula thermocuniculi TaxID=348842 RepID=UPI0004004BDF|nr:DUF6385 domain-containing protein [Desulfovirgula thermocuniculi]
MAGENRGKNGEEDLYRAVLACGLAGAFLTCLLGTFGILAVFFFKRELSPPQGGTGCTLPVYRSFLDRYLITRDEDGFSTTADVSRLRTFSFFVHNKGSHPVMVQLEMSPDGATWNSFEELPYVLAPGEKQLLVPQYFLRYARIRFRNLVPGLSSFLDVWFQGQS